MAIHYLHIGKSGGTALKYAIRQVGMAAIEGTDAEFDKQAPWESPLGTVRLRPHRTTLTDIPHGDHAFFSVRDPATRFVSSFYSRLRKGMPRHHMEWSQGEAQAFEWFPTPQELALALSKRRGKRRAQAEFAMTTIMHIKRTLTSWLGTADELRRDLPKVAYIARQETLSEDWERIKVLLGLPSDAQLPSDPVQSHRTTGDIDRDLSPKMLDALRDWYAEDYAVLAVCEEVRPQLMAGVERLVASKTGPS